MAQSIFKFLSINDNGKYSKQNNWYKLKGKCFACNEGNDNDTWKHREKDCKSNNGYLYINNECNVSCEVCDSPSCVLRWRFNWGRHDENNNEGYLAAKERYLIAAISVLAKNNDIPESIFIQMNQILLNSGKNNFL